MPVIAAKRKPRPAGATARGRLLRGRYFCGSGALLCRRKSLAGKSGALQSRRQSPAAARERIAFARPPTYTGPTEKQPRPRRARSYFKEQPCLNYAKTLWTI